MTPEPDYPFAEYYTPSEAKKSDEERPPTSGTVAVIYTLAELSETGVPYPGLELYFILHKPSGVIICSDGIGYRGEVNADDIAYRYIKYWRNKTDVGVSGIVRDGAVAVDVNCGCRGMEYLVDWATYECEPYFGYR